MKQSKENPPFIPYLLLKWLLKGEDYYEFVDDIDEIYQHLIDSKPKWKAKAWYSILVFESIPSIIQQIIYWRFVMIKNYIKIALRNFYRHKGYSFINIAGFAMGMACCLLIFLYIRHELSYDKHHQDAERIYRIAVDIRTQTANRVFAPIMPMTATTLKSDYPQVEYVARALTTGSRLVKREETFFYEDRFMYADQELFDTLTIPFVQGASQDALTRPQTVVISERMAHKYFGRMNPLGKTLEINQREFEVTGVVKDSPKNTHLKYDLIASLETLAEWEEMSNWHSTMFYTYLKLKPNVNLPVFSQQINRLADKYVGARLANRGITYHYFLQPISSIHLHSHIRYEVEPAGNPVYIYIFSCVGLFILIIACLNFMNLSTARSAQRAKETGLRKVVGAQRLQLIGQFLEESLLMASFSLFLAILLARFTIPFLNNMAGLSLSFNEIFDPIILISLVGGGILVGLAAGIYPAFVLSSFRPVATLKGTLTAGSHSSTMRTVLVVVQFAISAFLIIGTVVMYQQFSFMKNQYLGFEKDQKLILPLRGGISINENYETVKDLFSQHPSITGVTASSTVPGREVSNFGISLVGEEEEKSQSMFHLYFDHDFVPDYRIEILAGRAFQKGRKTDIGGAFLINESALRAFGWSSPEQALGKQLQTGYGGRVNPIIGVTKNFHYRGLQSEVEPLVMEFLPESFRCITLSIEITDLKETLAFVKSQWKTLFPSNPLESFFFDLDFDRQYHADAQIARIIGIFSLLGLIIACLGLLGLSSFTAESRTKEIGIRKVLGASVSGIVLMLSKQFTKWVLVANCIAWPLAYLAVNKWLENFAYRTKIEPWIFLISAGFTLFLALITISFQSIKVALANPIDSLRYE
jgi:putative ABC transport system permease protein